MPHKDPAAAYAYQRAYRQKNKEHRAAQRPDQDRARHANQRAREYGVPGTLRVADIRLVLRPDARCVYCGSTERLGIDHIIAMAEGGPNAVANLQPCCHLCNISKCRSDRPWRWSRAHDACVICGTSEIPHLAHGRCRTCHARERYQNKRAAA